MPKRFLSPSSSEAPRKRHVVRKEPAESWVSSMLLSSWLQRAYKQKGRRVSICFDNQDKLVRNQEPARPEGNIPNRMAAPKELY
jgi:hypothetical protein